MANDPGLANDTCIFMEAVKGDEGVHNANGVWWLSPHISAVGPAAGTGLVESGPATIKFRRKSAASNCLFPGDESVTVELWLANPSLVMSPQVRGSATRVGFIGSPVPVAGGTGVQQINSLLTVDDPQGAGRSLVARCYPDSGSPSNTNFFLPDDQHVAQRSLCVVLTAAKRVTFKVNTVNPGVSLNPVTGAPVAPVKLRALLDLKPNPFVSSTVLQRLQPIGAFQQLRTAALTGGFKFDLSSFQVSQVIDNSTQGLIPVPLTPPSFEAQVTLATLRVVQISFEASLQGVNPGEACIFHLIQLSTSNVVQGGLTLLVLRV